ncbi:MAG: hypothetical protein SFU53_01445 [Terrimicrobiaceae bacterium]|nr:hypothetical protein [Terrimicrobiaceae bacterium]
MTVPRQRSWLLVHCLFAAMLLAAFSPVWVGGRLLAPMDILDQMLLPWRGDTVHPEVHNHFVSDAITQYIPYRWFAHQSIRTDGYVGWNPLNYCGTPQYANTMTTSFDWTIQLHRWLDFWTAWHLGIFLQFWIAGAGMLVFLRSERVSPWGALLGAICYAGNFQFVAWIYHRWALGSFCWMPLVLWSLVPLTRLEWTRGFFARIPLRTLLAPGFLCLAFFGGSLQHSAFVVLAVAGLWAATAWSVGWKASHQTRAFVAFAGLGLIGTGLAAIMFVPCAAAFVVNQSMTGRAEGFGYPGGPLQPLLNLLVYPLFAFPWPMGSPDTLDIWKAFKTDLFNTPFVGFLPAALAVASFFTRRVPLPAKVLMALGFLLPLTPLVAPLYHRVFLVGILGGVWGACAFLEEASSDELRRLARWVGAFLAVILTGWILASVVVAVGFEQLQAVLHEVIRNTVPAVNLAVFPEWYLQRGTEFLKHFPIWNHLLPVGLAIVGVFCLWRNRRSSSRTSLVIALCVLAAAELTLFHIRWVTFSDRWTSPVALDASRDLYPATGMIERLRRYPGAVRLYTDPSTLYATPFPPNTLTTFGIATLRGYDSITDGIMEGAGAPTEDSPHLPDLGVTHALTKEVLTGELWETLDSGDGVFLSRFLVARPLQATSPTRNTRKIAGAKGAQIRISENWHPGWIVDPEGAIEAAPDGALLVEAPFEVVTLRFLPWRADRAWLISVAALVAWLFTLAFRVASQSRTLKVGSKFRYTFNCRALPAENPLVSKGYPHGERWQSHTQNRDRARARV